MQTNQSALAKHWVELAGLSANKTTRVIASFDGPYKVNLARLKEFEQHMLEHDVTYTGFAYLGHMTEQEFYSEEVPP
ncbi:hypothetical protein Acj133p105 [Acinetobacter phage 133]|uniref:Uncharacterized protein n=1 Tax=Acinetobacter phage 133 TaxID=2919552 RepID=D9I639_9CAUD|nr:hypothetical protein Acj133p105 [Acinetobacter phage 133]ADJ19420.1 hypothetical protein Acj133p105 [Acinetobacter phage 133]